MSTDKMLGLTVKMFGLMVNSLGLTVKMLILKRKKNAQGVDYGATLFCRL